ncbi:RNA polymerase sigma factor, partial [Amycolatopsis sp. H20-H5]|uniref:RNA polymerase sigma factor n=1 Tax=Amycolatopsis sp. H20-H5 TaxID=3046309 RepID=UPI002DBAA796
MAPGVRAGRPRRSPAEICDRLAPEFSEARWLLPGITTPGEQTWTGCTGPWAVVSRGWGEHFRRLVRISDVTRAERYTVASGVDADDRPDLCGDDLQAIFQGLFDKHARDVRRYLASRAGPTVADDLVSDTFLIALQRRASYDPARASARAWLFGIATNL